MSDAEKSDYEKAQEAGFKVLNSPETEEAVTALMDAPPEKEDESPPEEVKKDEGENKKPPEDVVKGDEKDEIDYEKAFGGKFKTKDEFENFHKESATYKDRITELEAELKTAKENVPVDPFEDNPDMARMYAIGKKTGINDFTLLSSLVGIDFAKIDTKSGEPKQLLELVKLQQLISEDFISDRSLSKKYFMEKPEDFDDLSDKEKEDFELEVEEKTALLRRDAKAAVKDLKEKGEVELPKKKTKEDIEKEKSEKLNNFVNDWKPKMPEIGKSLESITVKTSVPDIGDIEFNIDLKEVSEKSIEQVIHEMTGYLFSNEMKPTAEEISEAVGIAQDRLFLLNKDLIIQKIVEEAITTGAEGYREKVHNPSAKKPGEKAPDTQLSDYEKRKAEGKLF